MQALIRDASLLLFCSFLAFFWSSDGFGAFDGDVVCAVPAPMVRGGDEPSSKLQVVIRQPSGSIRRAWPRELVTALELPMDRQGLGPINVPEDAPRATKSRFALSYTLKSKAGTQVLPTTSPAGFGLGLMVFVLGMMLRNMLRSGHPLRGDVGERASKAVSASGPVQPSVPSAGGPGRRGSMGPPPSKRKRKKKKRKS